MDNWLEITVGVYLVGMILYGHYKGLIRLAVSMVALVATLVIVHFAMPKITVFIKENTHVYTWIADGMKETMGIEEELPDIQVPAKQRMVIENLNLPDDVKQILLENNNSQMYQILGVDAFAEYIGNYLANLIMNSLGFVILFLAVYILLHLIMKWLDLVARLPILYGMNHVAGAILGGIQGLFFLWIAALLITACAGTSWASAVLSQIEASPWLSFLYHYNLVSKMALGILRGILA